MSDIKKELVEKFAVLLPKTKKGYMVVNDFVLSNLCSNIAIDFAIEHLKEIIMEIQIYRNGNHTHSVKYTYDTLWNLLDAKISELEQLKTK